MSKLLTSIALCSAIAIGDDAGAPDWLHLLPVGEIFTNDGRGPYRVPDMIALMAASLPTGGKFVLDENHSTDLAAPRGEAAPARGWIVELQQRETGIWGRVEWTDAGRAKIEAREYRGVSPVILHRKDGTIDAVLRASLTNTPNFRGLTALHSQEKAMDFRAKLIEALGLDSEADDAAIMAAISAKLNAKGGEETAVAVQSALSPIATLIGLQSSAGAAAILAGVQQLKSGGSDIITSLQSELAIVTTDLNALRDDGKRKDATAFVDGAIAAQRVGIKPMRDRYISMHMADPVGTAELINAMPCIGASGISIVPPADRKADELGDADNIVIALMGVDPAAYKKTLAAQAGQQEAR